MCERVREFVRVCGGGGRERERESVREGESEIDRESE